MEATSARPSFAWARSPRFRQSRAPSLVPAGLLLVLSVACGSNAPGLPPGLEDALHDPGGKTHVYPAGPYGTEVGYVAHNRCFPQVWRDPVAAEFDPAEFSELCFSDFYDPDGKNGSELLLVNTAAIWCTGCKLEWSGGGSRKSLSEERQARSAAGFDVLGLLFEDQDGNPATVATAEAWTRTYQVSAPFGLDADFLMGAFASQNLQPFNMLLDARTMRILLAITGDAPEVIFQRVDEELEKRRR